MNVPILHPLLFLVISAEPEMTAEIAMEAVSDIPLHGLTEDTVVEIAMAAVESNLNNMSLGVVRITNHMQRQPELRVVGHGFNALGHGVPGALEEFQNWVKGYVSGGLPEELLLHNTLTNCYVSLMVSPMTLAQLAMVTLPPDPPRELPKQNAPSTPTLH
jgi:hypothetical protein